MGLLRKLKRFGSCHILPLLDGRRPSGDEAAGPNLDYGPLPASFFDAVNSAREGAGYEPLPVNARKSTRRRDQHLTKRKRKPEVSVFDQSRPPSNEERFDRAARRGSPDQLRRPLPGTPIKYRRRPISPELLHPSVSAPSLFGHHPHLASPDMLRHFQQAQQVPQVPRPPPPQFDMRPPPVAAQFYPQFQQPFYPMMYPHATAPNWFMMPQQQQQQQPMHPFY